MKAKRSPHLSLSSSSWYSEGGDGGGKGARGGLGGGGGSGGGVLNGGGGDGGGRNASCGGCGREGQGRQSHTPQLRSGVLLASCACGSA